MKILIVCNEYPPLPQGGIGTFTQFFARGLVACGHTVFVAGTSETRFCDNDKGVQVRYLGKRASSGPLKQRREFYDFISEIVLKNGIDIIEVPEFDGMLPFKFIHCPVVVRMHQSRTGVSFNQRKPPNPLMYFLERETLRKHRCWIGVSQFILDHNQKIFLLKPKLARVIYNFAPVINCVVDTTIPVGFGSYVVFIGKVTVAKGALDLAKAASIFLKKKEDIKIVYIGADGYRRGESVKELVLATIPTEFRDRVLFLGRRPHSEVIGWIKESIAVVLPSHLEAFSMVPLEAMAVGTPVIYTKLSSGPEVITSGEDGLLVDPHNYEEISSAVLLLANNYGFREKVSEQGRSKVNRLFSIEKCIDESVNFYREIINRNTYD